MQAALCTAEREQQRRPFIYLIHQEEQERGPSLTWRGKKNRPSLSQLWKGREVFKASLHGSQKRVNPPLPNHRAENPKSPLSSPGLRSQKKSGCKGEFEARQRHRRNAAQPTWREDRGGSPISPCARQMKMERGSDLQAFCLQHLQINAHSSSAVLFSPAARMVQALRTSASHILGSLLWSHSLILNQS